MSDRKLLTEWLAFDYSPEMIKESREENGGKLMMKGVLRNKGWQDTSMDPELLIYHHNKELQGMMSVHVDDIKIASEDWLFKRTISALETKFGKLAVKEDSFLNT